jgi:hypothetical protein
MSDYIWVQEKGNVIVWVSNDSKMASLHNGAPGCHAVKYVKADSIKGLEARIKELKAQIMRMEAREEGITLRVLGEEDEN